MGEEAVGRLTILCIGRSRALSSLRGLWAGVGLMGERSLPWLEDLDGATNK